MEVWGGMKMQMQMMQIQILMMAWGEGSARRRRRRRRRRRIASLRWAVAEEALMAMEEGAVAGLAAAAIAMVELEMAGNGGI
jgi:hypothetical protein